jgi:uncharacterized protein (DUF302 family)
MGMFLFIGGCHKQKLKKKKQLTLPPKELVVYCENSMLNMVLDLKYQFETA